jgi:hypothetical protein
MTSSANISIIHSLSSKEAGFGALSAFCVAKSNTNLRGVEFGFEVLAAEVREDSAIFRCAKVGGLNEESRTWRVLGGDFGGSEGIEGLVDEVYEEDDKDFSTLNVDLEEAKEERRV